MNATKSKPKLTIRRPKANPNHEGDICGIKQKDNSMIEFVAQPYNRSAKKFGKFYWSKQNEKSIHKENTEEKKSSKPRILPDVLSNIVATFAAEYRLLPWVELHLDKLSWKNLSWNPNAIGLLNNNLDKIEWSGLSNNPNAIELLKNNLKKINWSELSHNKSIFELNNQDIYNNLSYVQS